MYVGLGLFLFCLVSTQGHAELVSEWKFDGNAKDSVGNNHGTLKGNPTWGADRFGDQGKALSLDGKDDYVDCGNDASLSFVDSSHVMDRPFSITWWQKSNIVPNLSRTETGEYTGKCVGVLMKKGEYFIEWSNSFRVYLHDGNENGNIGRVGGVDVKQNEWTYIVVTYDSSRTSDGIKFYQDGRLVPSGICSGVKGTYTTMKNKNHPLMIGRSRGFRFNGLMDDVKIYNHALNPEEVNARYLQELPPAAAPLVKKGADTPEEVVIQSTSEASVIIDGSLSDKVWKDAKWYSGFHTFGKPQKQMAKPKTSFAMVHDDENLYIAVRADEPEPAKIKALVTKRDGCTWMDDSIEIFIDSEGEGARHCQFVVNSKGVLYDSQVIRGGILATPEWNSGAKVSTRINTDAWFLEISIPFSCLSFHPDNLTVWRLNIVRSRFVTSKRELFTYAPVRGSFHDTVNFVAADIRNVDLSPFLLNVICPNALKCYLRQGQMFAGAKLLIKNTSHLPREVDIRAILNVGGKEATTVLSAVRLSPDARHQEDITFPIPAMGKGILSVSIQDIESQKVVSRDESSVEVNYTPLKVAVLRPHYRNAIFAGQNIKDIELEVITAIAPEERQEYIFEFLLKSDKEILRRKTKIMGEKTIVSVPLPGLKAGKYQMEGKLIHNSSGNVTAKWQDILHNKLAPKKGEVRFDENMVCLIDNKPFLPFGIFGSAWPKGIWDAVELGCNSIEFCTTVLNENNVKNLDELHQAGLKLVTYSYPGNFPIPIWGKKSFGKSLTSEQEQRLRSHVRKWKDNPDILAWYTGNEPQPSEASIKAMKQVDNIIKEEDPYHPTLIINCNIKNIGYYEPAMALIMPDPYPGFIKNGGWGKSLLTTHSVKEAVRVSRGRKPVWVVMHAFNWNTFGKTEQRAPDFIELRNQMYQATIAGAKGFFWYCRYWIEPQVKIGLAYLAKEAQLLREAIFAPESSNKFTVIKGIRKSHDLHLSRRQVGKDSYLFAVSSSDRARNVKFSVSDIRDRKLFVVGEARNVRIKSGEFTDSFKPYDTHIYTTNESLAYQLNIAGVYKKIKANCTPIIKPGNLASKNCRTRLSWTRRLECFPSSNSIIDSIKGTSCWGEAGTVPSWVELTFDKPERISKVVVDSNISHLQVEVEKNGAWVKVAEVKTNKSDLRREVQTIKFPLVETKKLRLQSLALKRGKVVEGKFTEIWEIEVYGRKNK